MRSFLLYIFILFQSFIARDAAAVDADLLETTQAHSTGRLLVSRDALVPGETVSFGLYIKLEPGWHSYWKNPGDSASAPILIPVLPDGYQASEVIYPFPKRIPVKHLTSFGYEGETILLFDVKVPLSEAANIGAIRQIKLEAEWLVCKEECIPAFFDFAIHIPIASEAKNTDAAKLISAARTRSPLDVMHGSWSVDSEKVVIVLPPPDGEHGNWSLEDVFPFRGMSLANSAADIRKDGDRYFVTLTPAGGDISAIKARASDADDELKLLTVWKDEDGVETVSYDVIASFSSSLGFPLGPSFPMMLAFAFIGGLILNLMPCVFPVLMLKLFSLIKTTDHPKGKIVLSQLSYQLGILTSLWILAGILVGVRSTGQSLGWGFQLQAPWFVAVLVVLFFLIGLNFLGVFDVSSRFSGIGHELTQKKGLVGSFFTGVLAVVVASPCTAPFMGAAMGYALAQAPVTTFLIFTALGIGLGLPYLFFGLFPALAKHLPRPGNWMIVFKEFMAFPMWATMIWLLYVYNQQVGSLATSGLLVLIVSVAMVVWALCRLEIKGRVVTVLFAVMLAGTVMSLTMNSPGRAVTVAEADWSHFSTEHIANLRAENIPVFVNFTASWCISCQVNDQTTFQSAEIKDYVRKNNIAMVKADWTHYDESIARVLKDFDRAGVPLYLYYAPKAQKATILPEVLTPALFKQYVIVP